MRTNFASAVVGLTLLCLAPRSAVAQGTAFTYQGLLNDTNGPANGSYDLQFLLFDAAEGGSQQGLTLNRFGLAVSNGLFTTTLDYGANIFTGPSRWLEIRVAPFETSAFATLAPRQPLTPTPYAMYAPNAGTAASATSVPWLALTGVPAGLADGVDDNTLYSAGSGLSLAGTIFSLNTAFTDERYDGRYWKLTGNSGTAPGVNYLGTSDNQALEFKVNNARAFRLEPTTNAPNVIGGHSDNAATPGAYGAVIAGGANNIASGRFATIGGGSNNTATAHSTVGGGRYNTASSDSTVGGGVGNTAAGGWTTVAGGIANTASGTSSAVGGGYFNVASNSYTTIAGGWGNTAGGAGAFIGGGGYTSGGYPRGNIAKGENAVIGGGRQNEVQTNANESFIGGGQENVIQDGAHNATIGGGDYNTIQTNAWRATIGGGWMNRIAGTIPGRINGSTIAGGYDNTIEFSSSYSTVGGGASNFVGTNVNGGTIGGGIANKLYADRANIGGGWDNTLATNAEFAVISGGTANDIQNDATSATIGGGTNNVIQPGASRSTIGGGVANSIGTNSASATIAGGGYNDIRAGGHQSTIGGGVDHSIASTHGTVAGGEHHTIEAQASYTTIGGGSDNTIQFNADYSTVAGGDNHIIRTNATWATIGGGANNLVETNANYAVIPGGGYALASHHGQMAHAGGRFASNGDAQTSVYVVRRTTSNATQSELFLDGTGQQMRVPTGASWAFDALVVGRTATGSSAAFRLLGAVKNSAAGVTGQFKAPEVLMRDNVAWEATAGVDNATRALTIEVTGTAGTTIRWVASVRTVEVMH